MPDTALPFDLPGSLDAVHLRVRDAFASADRAAYARFLTPDLRYVDSRGRVQNREQLLRSLRAQFARLISFRSAFTRETLSVVGDEVVETGRQVAAVALRVFIVLEVRWLVTRHGRYTWRRVAQAGWQLCEVVLDDEHIQRDGVGFAGRAAYDGSSQHGAA